MQVQPTAAGARNYSQCDSMLIGDTAAANTYPYIAVRPSELSSNTLTTAGCLGGWLPVAAFLLWLPADEARCSIYKLGVQSMHTARRQQAGAWLAWLVQ